MKDFRRILNCRLAAAHIKDAIKGRGAFGLARAVNKSNTVLCCYKILDYWLFKYIMYLVILLHSGVIFWEPQQQDELPAEGVCFVVFVIHGICLLFYTVDIIIHVKYFEWKHIWNAPEAVWIKVEFLFVVFFYIDFLMLVIEHGLRTWVIVPFRCFRMATFICKGKNVGHVVQVCLLVMKNLGQAFLVVSAVITIFAATGVHMLKEDYHFINCPNRTTIGHNCTEEVGNVFNGSFDYVWIAAIRLFSLMTTSNYPDIIFPSFKTSHYKLYYFAVFLYIGVFFIMPLLLATIVDKYWSVSKEAIRHERRREREEIVKAWNILDADGSGTIGLNDKMLVEVLQIVKPECTEDEVLDLIDILDANDDGIITIYEWTTQLAEVMRYKFAKEKIRTLNNLNRVSYAVADFLEYPKISILRVLTIAVHTCLYCINWYGIENDGHFIVHIFQSACIAPFAIELFLKLITYIVHPITYLDVLDIVLILVSVGFNVFWYLIGNYFYVEESDQQVVKNVTVVISSLAVFTRTPIIWQKAKKLVVAFFKIFPIMFDLLLVVFIVMYFYGILGVEIFYNVTPHPDYPFAHYEYGCGIGFRTFRCSLYMMYQISTSSGWHDIMNASMVSASTSWTCLYFITYFIIINFVMLNLFVALTIEAFNKLVSKDDTLTFNVPNAQTVEPHPSKVECRPVVVEPSKFVKLSADKQRDAILKNRLRRKKEKGDTYKVDFIYRKKNEQEINLHVGEVVTVLEKKGKYWKGKVGDKEGWFPAHHLRLISKKKNIEETSVMIPMTGSSRKRENTLHKIQQRRNSKIILKKHDWRRDLHGDMTLISQEEIQYLNVVAKARLTPNHFMDTQTGDFNPITSVIEEEEEDDESHEVSPSVNVQTSTSTYKHSGEIKSSRVPPAIQDKAVPESAMYHSPPTSPADSSNLIPGVCKHCNHCNASVPAIAPASARPMTSAASTRDVETIVDGRNLVSPRSRKSSAKNKIYPSVSVDSTASSVDDSRDDSVPEWVRQFAAARGIPVSVKSTELEDSEEIPEETCANIPGIPDTDV